MAKLGSIARQWEIWLRSLTYLIYNLQPIKQLLKVVKVVV